MENSQNSNQTNSVPPISPSLLRKKGKQIIIVVVLAYLVIALFIFGSVLYNAKKESKDAIWSANSRDIKEAEGLLVPTKASIPSSFIGDKGNYGFGSNEGCFYAVKSLMSLSSESESAYYCYRFLSTTTLPSCNSKDCYYFRGSAETIEFRGISLADTSSSYAMFASGTLARKGVAKYTTQTFTYGNYDGALINYNLEKGNGTALARTVYELFWRDNTMRLKIQWSVPLTISRSPEDVIGLLHTLRRVEGGNISQYAESTTTPFLVPSGSLK